MPFQKGNKLASASKGDIRLKPDEWANFGAWLVQGGTDRLHAEMETLQGKDFVQAFCGILEYFRPKLARTELTGKNGSSLIPKPILDVPKNNSNAANNQSV